MSTRYEGAGAKDTRITVHMPETPLGDDVIPAGQMAVAFNYDEVFYIQGTPSEVMDLLARAERAVESVIQPHAVRVLREMEQKRSNHE